MLQKNNMHLFSSYVVFLKFGEARSCLLSNNCCFYNDCLKS